MKSKLYILISFVAVLIGLQASAFAEVSFSDVQSHWAKKDITAMVEKKFILGYPDGTFKPDKEVTKLDTLVLASRVLGVDSESNSEEVISAEDSYKTLLAKYNIYGKKEISFLLSRKVLLNTELDAYLKVDNAKAFTKRYEAAVIFTKIMGKENDVKNKTFVILPFMDSQDIPIVAKPYVEFMNDQGIMQGVNKNEFQPNTSLTRAQVATMLLRVSNKIGTQAVTPVVIEPQETTVSGTINYLDSTTNLMTVQTDSSTKSFTLLSDTPIKIDGSTKSFESLEAGYTVTVKQKGGAITEVNAAAREYEDQRTGPVTSVIRSAPMRISTKDGLGTDANVESNELDAYVNIMKNGKNASFDAIKVDDYATVYTLSNGKVGKITAEDKSKTISGEVESLTVDEKVYLTAKVDGKTNKYEVLSDVSVKRNNKTAQLKDVKAGDKVDITLAYNIVSKIEAESDMKTIQGTINEIYITKDPKITVQVGNKTTQYGMTTDAYIKVDNEVSTIYELRVGQKAEFNLDNSVITSVSAIKKIEALEVRGNINSINISLGVITLKGASDSTVTQIYVNSSTKVNNIETAATMKLSDLKEDQDIIAYGKNDRGVFVTSLIVVSSAQ